MCEYCDRTSSQFCQFDQCIFGAAARKPTQLVTNDMAVAAALRSVGCRGRCNHARGHPPAIGKSASGFKTTPLA
eukprot:7058813-Lingulodinium_polyedra.AAC.1